MIQTERRACVGTIQSSMKRQERTKKDEVEKDTTAGVGLGKKTQGKKTKEMLLLLLLMMASQIAQKKRCQERALYQSPPFRCTQVFSLHIMARLEQIHLGRQSS